MLEYFSKRAQVSYVKIVINHYFCSLEQKYKRTMTNSIKKILLLLFVVVPSITVFAQPQTKAFVVLQDISAEVDTLYAGDAGSDSYEAPLQVVFNAGVSDVADGTTVFAEWRVDRSFMQDGKQKTEVYLKRQDLETEYIFNDYGTFTVHFAYSYREQGSETTIPGEEQSSITFQIDNSELRVPNAFSPNNDGINDLFKVEVHSIVSFKMSIFNRWGQLIVSGDEKSLQYEGDVDGGYYICWDGTHKGETVGNGTYYIRIDAIGAGGKKYTRRSDINVLLGVGD